MKPSTKRFFKRSVLLCLIGLGVVFSFVWWILPWFSPLPPALLSSQERSPTYLSTEGIVLQKLLTSRETRHEGQLSLDQISPALIQATLSAEDQHFFQHQGIDFFAILRAAKDNLRYRRTVSGASTITQQLIKISTPKTIRRNLWTKIQESLQARSLEMHWSKEKILCEYLNRLDYGNQFIGIGAASLGYFDKKSLELSPAEAALLAAIPQNPTRLNPFKHEDRTKARQQRILALMQKQNRIKKEAYELAQTENLKLRRYQTGFAAPHLVHMLQAQRIQSSNQPIQTTLELPLQIKAIQSIQYHLEKLHSKNVNQAACVVIENATGKVRALVGSRDFWHSKQGQINGVWSPKSPGSAIKPFTYLMALENEYTPATLLADIPVTFSTPTGSYSPENYDRRYYGPIPLRQALGNSLNIPSVRLLHALGGVSKLYQRLQDLGITSFDQKAQHYGLGLTLGNAPVRLIELTNAYACLARLGQYQSWSLLEDDSPSISSRPLSEAASFLIADILSDSHARSLTFGSNSILNFPFPCAVKTGTSTDYRDNWALGYTPEYTVGVWVGNFDNSAMQQVSGISGAGPILRDIFLYLKEKKSLTWYTPPSQIESAEIDTRTGKLWGDQLIPKTSFHRKENFIRGTLPPKASASDYTEDKLKAFIDPIFKHWLAQTPYWLAHHLELKDEKQMLAQPPVIEFPHQQAVYFLDPDLPDQGAKMRLRVRSVDTVQWQSDTLKITREHGESYVWLEIGVHRLTASSKHGKHRIQFEVKTLGKIPSASNS